MKKVCAVIVSLSLIGCLFWPLNTIMAEEKTPKNIILIGWDGAQRNHIKEALAANQLPNLKQLSLEGKLVSIDITRTTDTKAGWTQILTGYEPEITGVYGNNRYQPIPKGYTVFERLENFFGPNNIVTGAVIGKKENVDADGPSTVVINPNSLAGAGTLKNKNTVNNTLTNLLKKSNDAKIIIENGKISMTTQGKPYYNAKDSMDFFINGLTENKKVGDKALEMIDKYKSNKFFFFIHFAEVDAQGHKFGENSKQYNDALISDDAWTGTIIQKLKDLNLYNDTLVYVTSDHGFDEGMKTHNDAPYVFMATNDKTIIRNGLREDIAPTIFDRFGVDLIKISPQLSGHSLNKVYTQPEW
jgi:hypothetical protein